MFTPDYICHLHEEGAMAPLHTHRRTAFPRKTTPFCFAVRLLAISVAIITQQRHVFALGFELSSFPRTSRCSTFVHSFPSNTLNNDVHNPPMSDLNSIKVEDETTKPKDYFISEALFVRESFTVMAGSLFSRNSFSYPSILFHTLQI